MKCPFFPEFGKWIVDHKCPYIRTDSGLKETDGHCKKDSIGKGDSWCRKMIGKAMMDHKTWIGNDY